MRLVSLVCSNTEIVHALGMASHLVGVDDYSDFPEEVVGRLPRLGPELGIDIAAVASLRPDLVLASLSVPGHERVVEGLEREGLPLLVLDPTSLSEVLQDIRTVARVLGVEQRGDAVVGEMEAVFAEVGGEADADAGTPGESEARRGIGSRPTGILIQWWPKPVIAPGRLSWVQDLLHMAGAANPLGEEDVRSRPMTDEEVAGLVPEAIVLSWCGVHPSNYRPDVIYRNPLWQRVPALRHGQVHCVPEAYLGRPGPRLIEGARALRGVVRSVRGRICPSA
jgi:iron complex transport system substrate-binding protein